MGYERKRGKLADLNAMLRGARDRFAEVVGDTAVLRSVRYVITLDTDTQLPRDAARADGRHAWPIRSIGRSSMHAQAASSMAIRILQPRVGVSLPSRSARGSCNCTPASGRRSLHARRLGRLPGSVRRRLVHRQRNLRRRFLRAALRRLSRERDPEPRPDRRRLLPLGAAERRDAVRRVSLALPADVSRRHRWMRGDWQIAAWLLPWVRGAAARPTSAIRSRALSRWKIFDNLRRSLVPIAMLLVLLVSLVAARIGAGVRPRCSFWRVVVLSLRCWRCCATCCASRSICRCGCICARRCSRCGKHAGAIACARSCFLPYEAYISADAIVRTLVRMLLDQTADCWNGKPPAMPSAARRQRPCWIPSASMWIAPALADRGDRCCCLRLSIAMALACVAAARCCGLVSPLVAWWLSRPIVAPPAATCPRTSSTFCEKLSRRTWRYFEEFVTAEENWLPPDNIQQNPHAGGRVAHQSDEHRHGAAGGSGGLRFRLLLRGAAARPHAERRSPRWRGWSAIAGIFSTGTTRDRSRPCIRAMSRRSTAAIWPANLLVLRQRLARIDRCARSCRRACSAACAIRCACCSTWPADCSGRPRRSMPTCCARSSARSKISTQPPRRSALRRLCLRD